MTDPIRWGIIGTGNIAGQFARGLAVLPDATLAAVGSRRQESADAFGNMFDVPNRHPTYQGLVNDPEVEAIYIATPHTLHYENTLACLNAGKAVLCEKPFAINANQAREMIELARRKQIFLMEAVWSRFIPLTVKVRQLLAAGVIGEPRMLNADFGFRADFDPQSRLFDPALGGGALLDVGLYPVNLAYMVFGRPTQVTSLAHLGSSGVDEQAGMLMSFEQGQIATLSTAIRTDTPQEAYIMGTKGWIKIHTRWWIPDALTLTIHGQEAELIEIPYAGNGYNYEAAEVANCLRAGKLESEIMPLDETLAIIETLDRIRAQWGLNYPIE